MLGKALFKKQKEHNIGTRHSDVKRYKVHEK